MTTRKIITYMSSNDWDCEHTEEDNDRWLQFVADHLAATFPSVEVEVQSTAGESRATVSGLEVDAAELESYVGVDLWEAFCAADFGRKGLAGHHGKADAQTFALEHPDEVAAALAPGAEAPAAGLVNALGVGGVAELFGLMPQTGAFQVALDDYSGAYLAELRRLAVWSLRVEGDGDAPASAVRVTPDIDLAVEDAVRFVRSGGGVEPGKRERVRYYLSRGGEMVFASTVEVRGR